VICLREIGGKSGCAAGVVNFRKALQVRRIFMNVLTTTV